MKRLTQFFQQLQLSRIFVVLIAGFVLFLSTACGNSYAQGAHPDNPATQMGGMNNPYKAGGDVNTNYRMSTDPKVSGTNKTSGTNSSKLHSSLGAFDNLIASNTQVKSDAAEQLIYPGKNAGQSENPDIGPLGDEYKSQFNQEAGATPAGRQPVIERSNPNEKILEKTGKQFQEATQFIKDAFEGQAED